MIVLAGDAEWGQVRGLCDHESQRESAGKLLADGGALAAHLGHPGHRGSVVAPHCGLNVVDRHEPLQHEELEEDAGHFEVVDGDQPGVHGLDNLGGPCEAPHHRAQGVGTGEPDASRPVLACVAESDKVGEAGDELGAGGGAFADFGKDGAQVSQGLGLGRPGMNANDRLLAPVGGFEDAVEGCQQCGAAGHSEGGVLALSHERPEVGEGHGPFAEELLGQFAEGFEFLGGELDGSVEAIKDPPEDFLACVPDAFLVEDQFLVGDGVFSGVPGGRGGGKIWWMAWRRARL